MAGLILSNVNFSKVLLNIKETSLSERYIEIMYRLYILIYKLNNLVDNMVNEDKFGWLSGQDAFGEFNSIRYYQTEEDFWKEKEEKRNVKLPKS